MEESAPKRRRTSPRSSLAIRPWTDNDGAASTPAESPEATRSRRPSFASPTKSSLARSNPDILERRQSSQRPRGQASPTRATARSSEGNSRDVSASQGSGPAAEGAATGDSVPRASLSQPPKRLSGRDLLAERAKAAREQASVTGSFTPQPGRETNPSSTHASSRETGRLSAGGFGALPRRSPVKPVPRPLPPSEGPEEEINPFAGRVLQRTPPGGRRAEPVQAPAPEPEPVAAAEQADPESDLPPTPRQQGKDDPVVTSPAEGIHDTPSKRARRRSSKGMKSSPLKGPPLRPPDLERPEADPSKIKGKGKAPARVSDKDLVISINDEEDEDEIEDVRSGPHPARHVAAFDSQPEKADLLVKLQAEARQLEDDLSLATQENDRIRSSHGRRRGGKPVLEQTTNPEALRDLLRRHLLPADQASQPDVTADLFSAALNPTSWFSLGTLTGSGPALALTQTKEVEAAPASHHPVPMSADEQLPFLQVFTPFTLSSTTVMLPRDAPEDTLLRQHTISVSSATPPGLFAAKIEMTVNTDTLRVDTLRVPRLDPAAIAELGPFVESQCEGKRNVSVMCWAMAEWYRIAVERARFWHELEEQVQSPGRLVEMVREARKTRRRKKRRNDADGAGEDDPKAEGQKAKPFTRAAALAHMGRTAFEVPVPEDGVDESKWSCLRLQWRIEFDWTGEGHSRMGVMVGMPGKWHEADDGQALSSNIKKVFAGLIKGEKSPATAVRTVVALLAGDVRE